MRFVDISGGSATISLDMEEMWSLAKLARGMCLPPVELEAEYNMFQCFAAACEAATLALTIAGGTVGGHRFSLAKLLKAGDISDPALLQEWYGDSGQSDSPDKEDGDNEDAVR